MNNIVNFPSTTTPEDRLRQQNKATQERIDKLMDQMFDTHYEVCIKPKIDLVDKVKSFFKNL